MYAWTLENSGGHANPVGQKKPNPWGLFDMYGNVWEFYVELNVAAPSYRWSRGGSWRDEAVSCRSTQRFRRDPSDRDGPDGFRVVMIPYGVAK